MNHPRPLKSIQGKEQPWNEYWLHGNKYIILITSIVTMDSPKLMLIIDTVFYDWSTLYHQTFEVTNA